MVHPIDPVENHRLYAPDPCVLPIWTYSRHQVFHKATFYLLNNLMNQHINYSFLALAWFSFHSFTPFYPLLQVDQVESYFERNHFTYFCNMLHLIKITSLIRLLKIIFKMFRYFSSVSLKCFTEKKWYTWISNRRRTRMKFSLSLLSLFISAEWSWTHIPELIQRPNARTILPRDNWL